MIDFRIEDATDCQSCRTLLIPGDRAYRDEATQAVGCSPACCRDAALIHADRTESEEYHSINGFH